MYGSHQTKIQPPKEIWVSWCMSWFCSFLSCTLSRASLAEKHTHFVYQITTQRWTTSQTTARTRWIFLSIKLITSRKTIKKKKNLQKKVPSHASQKHPLAPVISGTSSTKKGLGNFLSQFQNRFIQFFYIILPSLRLDLLNVSFTGYT